MGDAIKRFGKRVSTVRRERGMSQEALAKSVGLTRSHVGRLEIGLHADVPLSTIERIAKALRLPVGDLLK